MPPEFEPVRWSHITKEQYHYKGAISSSDLHSENSDTVLQWYTAGVYIFCRWLVDFNACTVYVNLGAISGGHWSLIFVNNLWLNLYGDYCSWEVLNYHFLRPLKISCKTRWCRLGAYSKGICIPCMEPHSWWRLDMHESNGWNRGIQAPLQT